MFGQELATLYEKIKIQQSTLQKGEIQCPRGDVQVQQGVLRVFSLQVPGPAQRSRQTPSRNPSLQGRK